MSWKMIDLSADDIKSGVEYKLQNLFMSLFVAAGLPPDAVMYSNKEYVTEGYRVLFTPRAAEIVGHSMSDYPLVDCTKPAPDELDALVKYE